MPTQECTTEWCLPIAIAWAGGPVQSHMAFIHSDIGIVGGGPVGAAFAAAMSESRFSLSLIEPRAPVQAEGWDIRIYAISPSNRLFLGRIGAWPAMDQARVCPVQRMLVFSDDGARLEFTAYEAGVPELAWIVEAGALSRALWSRIQCQDNLELLCPATPAELTPQAAAMDLVMTDGRQLQARLVVGADGARSFVRQAAGILSKPHPDRQMGVVANFECERPHGNTAFQWFRPDGVLAWLPLPGRQISMVWSTSGIQADELMSLPATELCARVAGAGNGVLGGLTVLAPAAAFPISRMAVSSMVASRMALVGDAAHVVHPLAGQGVNLGLQDAAALADVLSDRRIRDPGDTLALRRFERRRKEDILAMRWATDGLDWLFHSEAASLRRLRQSGVKAVNSLSVFKTLLVRHALG